jgi:hypothetical protein
VRAGYNEKRRRWEIKEQKREENRREERSCRRRRRRRWRSRKKGGINPRQNTHPGLSIHLSFHLAAK